MNTWIGFSLVVGIGSTVVLDLWVTLVKKVLDIPPTNWGMVGRWIGGLAQGKLVLDTRNDKQPNTYEKALGWAFHYLIGIGYAVMLLLFWGPGFASHPTVLPIFIIGVVVSTLAGLAILMPAMGGGFFASNTPNPKATYLYLIIAHCAFAIGQYGFALWYAA
ncbi:DUF2938 family protein [Gallaecimonas mangrovi]|uniref:DUF2938 family protein n=1 Tax=Gallaecimonas mangrovi TaxID=2291597 RepID=UPI000E2056A6|nr:DUF2938 family protein [Gallaecimonas mangrovi]